MMNDSADRRLEAEDVHMVDAVVAEDNVIEIQRVEALMRTRVLTITLTLRNKKTPMMTPKHPLM